MVKKLEAKNKDSKEAKLLFYSNYTIKVKAET